MPPLWALLALGCLRFGSAVNLQPQLASVTFATNNPTLTTVALEKPLCMFDSSEALTGSYEIHLYVLVDSAGSRNASVQDGTKTPLSSTFQQTEGGRTGPYKAAAFDLSPCSDLPSLDAVGDVSQASQILDAYLVRVGANSTCLWDPNFQGLCNAPLSGATEYRFKYVLVNMSTGLVQDQTLWSDPIRTKWDMGSSDGETTHDSQITQEAVPKSLGTSEPSYTSVNRGPPLDRAEVYSTKLQD
uniref:Uroplakin 3A n=1 Tax=Propithecus coquereli TaxID=379532 RepID=A0A2K6FB83_PROCO